MTSNYELRSGSPPDSGLSLPFLTLVPGDGASVATFGTFAGNETISSTDSRAGRIDQLQFDLNEGPCWDALQQNQPVVEPDVRNHPTNRWPAFLPAAADDGVGALFAIPLRFGPFLLGAVDVYARGPLHVSADAATAAVALADAVSRRILHRLIVHRDHSAPIRQLQRRSVHQAAGIVLAHLGLTPTDAYLLIQGHAAARDETTADTANQILTGELRITPTGDLTTEPHALPPSSHV
ncbi:MULTISPECIES: GAF and ANTAR domain-containing protein [unclassified Curtobacterium]|uniref:GAF and ANTAR domain-containing protein n=1 Tax=unclassified Curtobacterium TaxID=257496 RepID=UPI000D889BBC|nr:MULTISPECIES: GAF and ANTAR domain-containing protein [unclassified Curtobacterium]PYY55886.1 hypothetical protein DEJ17_12460 [Curtobacterium sp. MCSS17_011]WIB72518.1 GAF and ANTAR domain-containing protein [Curtobacterium sp. MCBD17_026]WIE79218.1 GAF and ANTAR domain-containing protein [Curtobacterium sp. MCSS17_016]